MVFVITVENPPLPRARWFSPISGRHLKSTNIQYRSSRVRARSPARFPNVFRIVSVRSTSTVHLDAPDRSQPFVICQTTRHVIQISRWVLSVGHVSHVAQVERKHPTIYYSYVFPFSDRRYSKYVEKTNTLFERTLRNIRVIVVVVVVKSPFPSGRRSRSYTNIRGERFPPRRRHENVAVYKICIRASFAIKSAAPHGFISDFASSLYTVVRGNRSKNEKVNLSRGYRRRTLITTTTTIYVHTRARTHKTAYKSTGATLKTIK